MHHIFLCLCLVGLIGCRQSQSPIARSNQTETTAPSPAVSVSSDSNSARTGSAAKAMTDACALLTAEEIASIQGEPVKETKLSARSDGGFSISQCFFTLPTFTNSVSLAVTQKMEGQGTRDPREFWDETFHRRSADKKREREREREGEKEEEGEPEEVKGVGDEAFWMGSRVGGALYVLKGGTYIRVSIGGAADQETKIKKSKALAQKVVARL